MWRTGGCVILTGRKPRKKMRAASPCQGYRNERSAGSWEHQAEGAVGVFLNFAMGVT